MGLDMFLTRNLYTIGPSAFKIQPTTEANIDTKLFNQALKPTGDSFSSGPTVSVNAIYWRKANAIHNWFVENVQDGNDDCGEYDVSIENLEELRNICKDVITKHDDDYSTAQLPPAEGFFFGGTDIDKYYYDSIRDTLNILNKELQLNHDITADPNCKMYIDYSYHASW